MHPEKMKSMQTKGRNKKKNEKFFVKSTSSTIRPDLSNLRKPIDTSVSDLHQVSGLLKDGTDEVKSILSYECNIIYECRTCHSLFRSIVNLVSHKREYCREKFDITLHRRVFHNYNLSAKESIIHMYKTEQTSNEVVKNDRILRSQVPKEPNKKDLSTIIDMLNKKREESTERQLENESAISDASNHQHIYLQSIDTNCSAVYQTIKSSNAMVDTMDLMKEQITELQNMADQNALTSPECSSEGQMPENQLEKSDSPIMDMSDEENELLIYRLPTNNLSCAICNAKFSTKKTLTVHTKTLHASQRMFYPCPCCTSTFANTWSVYRHLYKVHKKTNEQVRKLRTQIQEKAFQRKTTAIKENVRAREASALKDMMENNDKIQESKSHTKSNIKIRSCSRRDRRRRLNKKASFKKTYLQYCQTPVAACDETTIRIKRPNKLLTLTSDNILYEAEDITLETNKSQKIEPSGDKNISDEDSENILSSSKICDQGTFIRVQAVSSFSKEDWNMIDNKHNCVFECSSVDNNNDSDITSPVTQNIDNSESLSLDENRDNLVPNKNVKSPDITCTDTNEVSSLKMRTKKDEASSHDNKKQSTDLKERDMIEAENDNPKSQSSCSIQPNGKNRASLMENKLATIANFRKLQCLLCRRKFTSIPNLRRHMATHIGWNRYRCKLCDFKCFVKCDCVAHCNKVHNMQNNRAALAEMVVEISQDEYMCNEDVITDVTSARTVADSPEATDIIASSCQSETRTDLNSSNDLNTTLFETTATSNEQVAESHGNAEDQSVDAEDSDKADGKLQDLSECMMNCGSGKLDTDPELKRMVMEVIFGSTDVSATEQTDSDKPILEASNGASGCADAKDNTNNTTDESKETSCPILVKHQRPTRNRIKPLSEDFIYDLREAAYRKESALFNDSETLHVRKKAKLYN